MNGLSPIGWQDLNAFCHLTRTQLTPFDIEMVEMLDDLYLASVAQDASEKDRQQAQKDGLKAAGKPRT